MVITCELRLAPGWFNRDTISGAYKCSDSPTEIRPQSLLGMDVSTVCHELCVDFETGCREWLTWRLYKVTGQDFFFSCPRYFFPYLFSSSYLLPLFHCLISILLFPCAGVWEKHSCMSSSFSIAILNGTCSLRAPILFCGDVPALKN